MERSNIKATLALALPRVTKNQAVEIPEECNNLSFRAAEFRFCVIVCLCQGFVHGSAGLAERPRGTLESIT